MDINLELYKVFYYVATTLSFSEASRQLFISQSAVSQSIKALEKKLTHNLDRDLDYFSKDIKSMIADEIIKRYYYTRGGIIQQLKDDDGLQAALKILADPVKYKETLSAPVKK